MGAWVGRKEGLTNASAVVNPIPLRFTPVIRMVFPFI